MINYQPLSNERKKECYKIMAVGNVALTRCGEALEFENTKDFRKFLFRHNLSIKSMATEISIGRNERKMLEADLPKIQAVRDIEVELLQGFCNVARKVAVKLHKAGTDDVENYTQEGFVALIDAIYGYKNESIEFTTFLHVAVRNHLLTVIRHDTALSPVSRDAMSLKHQFDKMRKTVNGPCTDEEIFIMLGWEVEQRSLYRDATTTPMHASVLSEAAGVRDDDYDYTQFRADGNEEEESDFLAVEGVREALANADLSDMERLVVETSMNPYYGWQTKLAESNINPDTQRPYSRRAIGYMLNSALAKIKAVCKLKAA